MMIRHGLFIAMSCAVLMLICGKAEAIVMGQVDDFQDGTVQNWGPNFSGVASNAADSGPSGVGDHALLASSTGTGRQGSRSIVLNGSQWTGDWTGEGVTEIEFDARNPNNFDIELWLGIAGPGGAGSAGSGDVYVSLGSAALSPGSGWEHFSFDVTEAGFEQATNHFTGTVANALTGVTQFRIFHNIETRNDPNTPNNFIGDVVDAEFYLDNITATPEPGSLALLTIGGLALAGRRRRS